MAMTEDEFVRKAKKLYQEASDREKDRIENDKWYFHDWIQRLIGWLAIIVDFVTKLCFVSSAVFRRIGTDDNCIELEILREFRDNYLLNSENKEKLADVEEYYRLAPGICLWIEGQENASEIWEKVEKMVFVTVDLIRDGRLEDAYRHYKMKILEIIPCLSSSQR